MVKRMSLLLLLLTCLGLSACGGGGGDAPATGSSNWDAMQWDQDNWS